MSPRLEGAAQRHVLCGNEAPDLEYYDQLPFRRTPPRMFNAVFAEAFELERLVHKQRLELR
jgi:hypothetical protein